MMLGVVGTVISIKDLFEKKETQIAYKNENGEEKVLIHLKADRKYSIPLYQREIRWSKHNLLTLICDVEKGAKFLGNIILSETPDGNFEILDGQQRSTIVLLLINYIRSKYSTRFSIFEMCDFQIDSFLGFNKLFEAGFDLDKLTEGEKKEINDSDDYQQMKRYMALWKDIESYGKFEVVAYASSFLKQLSECEVNVIINKDSVENSIARFLDVNLKGVRLDTEDILKSYLCAQDSTKEIHDIWSSLKKKDFILNNDSKIGYSLTTIFEHYFRCVLPLDTRYSGVEFDSKFEITKEIEIEGTTYTEGTHIVQLICDKSYIRKCLDEIQKVMELLIDIAQNSHPGTIYKGYFAEYNQQAAHKKQIDNDEIEILHNLSRKILFDKDKVPNCLLIKYFVETFIKKSKIKEEYERLYGISVAALTFSLFQNKKDITYIEAILKENNWEKEICQYVKGHLEEYRLSDRQVVAAYRYTRLEREATECTPQQFRCKTIATIFNFYTITEEKITIKKGEMKNILTFLNDSERYSVEHFIINDSGACDIELDNGIKFVYEYPKRIKKYQNSLFNYIFISRENNNALGNRLLSYKLKLIEGDLKHKFEDEKCAYSKCAVEAVKQCFHIPDIAIKETEEEAREILDKYFEENFVEETVQFSNEMIGKVI